MKNDDVLYLFQHIPKTAGTTFARHIIINFRYAEVLSIVQRPNRILNTREAVDRFIESLSAERKDQVRVVCGHSVYYGIDRYFHRTPRYFTFFRDPIQRAISNYNHTIANYDLFQPDSMGRFPANREDMTFDCWWERFQPNVHLGVVLNFMVGGKAGWMPDLRLDDSHLRQAKAILDEFYFVGLTETFEEDSLFLYGKIGIKSFLKDRQNIAPESFVTVTDDLKRRIAKDAALDVELYRHAIELNHRFRREHQRFTAFVRKIKSERKFVTPLRFIVIDTVQGLLGQRRALILIGWLARTVKATLRILGLRRG